MPQAISPNRIGFNQAPPPGEKSTFRLPFAEQIAFFRQKLNLPTQHWDDILKSAHDRAFVVAGAMKADLLTDLHEAVGRTIAEGKSLGWFRSEFKAIVAARGWHGWTGEDTKAGRAWRTRVIYTTNLRTSYAAGRYAQLTSPRTVRNLPYWKYVHNDTVLHPRPLHVKWGNKPVILHHTDSWWQTHFPPNGWGCRCRVTPVTADEFKGDAAPDDGTYEKVDRNGEIHELPAGIDYGWDYAPGSGLFGQSLPQQIMDQWQRAKADAWETLTQGSAASYQRPAVIPADQSAAAVGPRLKSKEDVVAALRSQFGGDEKIYSVGGDFSYPLLVNAEVLGSHIDSDRSPFIPFIDELLTDPFEVWAMVQRHKGTGKAEFRVRMIKQIDLGKGKGLLFVAQANKGALEAWTFVPVSNMAYIDSQRRGVLVYAR